MHFSPASATSIDLCVRELAGASRHRKTTKIVVEHPPPHFCSFDVLTLGGGRRHSTRKKAKLIRRLLQQLDEIDVIVVEQHLPTASAIAAMTQLPVVLHTHNYQRSYGNSFGAQLRRLLRLHRYARLAGIVHVSKSCCEYFAQHWPDVKVPQTVIYNGIDTTRWRPAIARSDEILCVARNAPEKGVLEVATALAAVLQQRQHWRARFVLSEFDRNPDYNARVLQELAPVRDRTTIETDKTFEHVKLCYERAAIAIIASKWQEPFGRTCLEAHAGGCAVISSGTGGLSEISGPSAHYLQDGHPNEIAEACLGLIDNGARRQELAMAGLQEAQRFDLSQLASQLDDFLARVVQTKGDGTMPPIEGRSFVHA